MDHYDGHNRRVKTVQSDGTVRYNIFDGERAAVGQTEIRPSNGTLLQVYDATTDTATDYISGPHGALARVRRTATANVATFVHADHLGTARAGSSASGAVLWQDFHTPYGESLTHPAATDDQGDFTGHIRDKQTGLTYMQARYYDPVIGRFLSVDPVTMLDMDMNPNYFNRYAYTFNDPINAIDPDGRKVVFKHPTGTKNRFTRTQTRAAIKKISATPTGGQALKQLKDSSNVHTINVGPTIRGNSTSPTGSGGTVASNGQNGSGTRTTINWDPSDTTGGVNDNGSTTRDPSICLGHEVGHAADLDNGSQIAPVPLTRDSSGNVVVPQTPAHETGRSMQIEQEMRTDQGATQRTNYVQ